MLFRIATSSSTSSAVIASVLAFTLAACATDRPRSDAQTEIATSLALEHAVEFRFEADPLDAEAPDPDFLSAAEALRRAVATSAELQAALARVHAAGAEADLAASLRNPLLDVALRMPEGGGRAQLEAGLGADVLALLQRPRRSSAALHRFEAAVAHALSTALDVAAEAQTAYANAQALEVLLPTFEERHALLVRLRDVARTRVEVGDGVQYDVATFDAELAALELDLARLRDDQRRARLALARTIGRPSSAAAWRLDAWTAPQHVESLDEARCIEIALRKRPDVLAIEWELRAREDEEALAHGEIWDGAAVGVSVERDDAWSTGPSVAVPLPLFDDGDARSRRARALTAEERHRWTAARRTAIEDVRGALLSLDGALANLRHVRDDVLPLQVRRRTELEEAYRLGWLDLASLLRANDALATLHAQRIELEREVTHAHVRVQRALGGSTSPSTSSRP